MPEEGTIRIPTADNGEDPFAGTALEGASREELEAARQLLEQRLGGGGDQPKFQYTLPDGRQIQGTQEEVQQALNEYWQQSAGSQPDPQPSNERPAQPPQWDDNVFKQRYEKEGAKGAMDYYLETKFQGHDPVQLMSTLAAALQNVGGQVLEFGRDRFMQSHEGAKNEHYDEAMKFCSENGMPVNPQNLERAYVWLKHEGRIKDEAPQQGRAPQGFPQAQQQPQPQQSTGFPESTQQFVPAHLPTQGTQNPGWQEVPNDEAAIDRATSHMTTDQLRSTIDQILANQGGLPN